MPELELKKGWTKVAFGDVVKLSRERTNDPEAHGFDRYVGLDHLEPGDLKIRRWGNIAEGTTFTSVFRPGKVLFGKRRAYQRKVAVADFSGVCSGDIYVLEPKNSSLIPELLPFICLTDEFFKHAVGTSAGSLSPRTKWDSLSSYEFALPPLDDQEQIVNLLAAAESTTARHLDLLEISQFTEIRLFSEMLTKSKPSRISLGSLLTEPPRNGCSAPETSTETGHWVLALSAITKWGYKSGELKSVEKTVAMSRAILTRGDILISRSNTRELVGLPIVFEEDRRDVSWPDTMMRLTPDESQVTRRYLELFLRSPFGRRQVQSYAAGTSASMKKINATNVRKINILLPQLNQQQLIEDTTGIFRHSRKALQERMFELRNLRRLLIRRALAQGVEKAP
jgi:type I restriction enzyme, S subunit